MRTLTLILVLTSTPVYAERRVELPTANERKVADIASWVTVLTAVALDTAASWQCNDRSRCFGMQGARLGVTYGATYVVKTVVHRTRPCAPVDCGIDHPNTSFYSGHTAAAFQTLGGPRLAVALPFAVSTGGLRVAAGKHWVSDVVVGAGVGLLTSRIR